MYCTIAFPADVYQTFTYREPEALREKLHPGVRVKAPFGPRAQLGYCLECFEILPEKPGYALKSIESIFDEKALFTPALIKLLRWISEYYLAAPGLCFRAAHPSEIGFKRQEYCFVAPHEDSAKWPEIPAGGLSQLDFTALPEARRKALKAAIADGRLYIDNIFPRSKSVRKVAAVRLLSNGAELTLKQQSLVNLLASLDNPVEEVRVLLKKLSLSSSVVRTLIEKGVLESCEMEVPADPFESFPPPARDEIRLSDEQNRILKHIRKHENTFYPVLLHGITGSGKTEIYIRLASEQLDKGRSVLMLVPEIAITPQIAARFRAAFGESVAIWHSQMRDAERLWTWNQILRGNIRVVVGARSALFAPLPDIGLIIVDEEQEATYKQDDPVPRYHARDAAVMYGHILNIPVLLGSATPSLESYYLSAIHRYKRLELHQRYGDALLPRIRLIDMGKTRRRGLFSEKLLEAVHHTLENNKQVIILQNRRGYHTLMVCSDCAHVLQCPSCSVSLTYHKRLNKLLCHVCNNSYPLSRECPHCGKKTLQPVGSGTQRIEEELQTAFPQVRIARMDMDTTRTRHAHARILTDFEEHRYDILLGTQMIAKGLDFPDVTLVGIVNADIGLGFPDYRAGERLFHLIYQVSGRSGRGKHPGEVLIQTFNPEEALIRMAAGLELKEYYNLELFQRKNLNYPPFSRLFLIRFSGNSAPEVEAAAMRLYREISEKIPPSDCLGPAPAPIERIQNKTRWQILIKAGRTKDPNGNRSAAILMPLFLKARRREKKVNIIINRDPVSLM
ncbi:MAG: primosomal protein N' [bacterium]|jgi:primosomal protein N' (replication factor Y)|nr:primosomal protein N' [bacterium]